MGDAGRDGEALVVAVLELVRAGRRLVRRARGDDRTRPVPTAVARARAAEAGAAARGVAARVVEARPERARRLVDGGGRPELVGAAGAVRPVDEQRRGEA